MDIGSFFTGISTGVAIATIIVLLRDNHFKKLEIEEKAMIEKTLNDIRKIKGEL